MTNKILILVPLPLSHFEKGGKLQGVSIFLKLPFSKGVWEVSDLKANKTNSKLVGIIFQ
jgi:hypothetical protein